MSALGQPSSPRLPMAGWDRRKLCPTTEEAYFKATPSITLSSKPLLRLFCSPHWGFSSALHSSKLTNSGSSSPMLISSLVNRLMASAFLQFSSSSFNLNEFLPSCTELAPKFWDSHTLPVPRLSSPSSSISRSNWKVVRAAARTTAEQTSPAIWKKLRVSRLIIYKQYTYVDCKPGQQRR